jgi:hypothetical protein
VIGAGEGGGFAATLLEPSAAMSAGVQECVHSTAAITRQEYRDAEIVEREERAGLGEVGAEAHQQRILFEQRLAFAGEQLRIGVDAVVEPIRLCCTAGGAVGMMGEQALGNLHQHLSFVQHGSP